MQNDIVTVSNFSKKFGDLEIIKKLDFEVKEGEIFAFLGANGSGKTTTLRCLLNIYQPTSGELLINGKKYSESESSYIGYLPEERGLYLQSSVLELLTYFGQLKEMAYSDAKKSALDYLKKVDLADKTKLKIKQLSSGQQQKIQLGITIINKPKLLILDEPTKGLDPVNRTLLMNILLELNKSGSTIIFSTHQMEEAEKIANRLLMIKSGKKKLYGQINEIKNSFGQNRIKLNVRNDSDFPDNTQLYSFKKEGNYIELKMNENSNPEEILEYLVKNNVKLSEFQVSSPSLDEIFIQVSAENEE